MQLQVRLLAIPVAFALTTLVAAQTNRALPSSLTTVEGNANNTIPFWATSSTYQQVHDDRDMLALNGGAPVLVLGMGFRKDGGGSTSIPGRTMDVQIAVNVTTFDASTMTTTFATNLGATPTIAFPYAQVNMPTLLPISTPNPVGFSIPFAAPYPFLSAPGNHFVWEMRIRNASSNANASMDASSGSAVSILSLGTGCVVSGQSRPANIGTRGFTLTTGTYRNKLDLATATTPASFFLGVQPQQITLPGLCSSLEVAPLVVLNGVTDASGSWDLVLSTGYSLVGYPSMRLVGQFVFFDATLPLGLGLSNATDMTTPGPELSRITRLWNAPFQGGAGNENATTGSMDRYYGLVTILQTP
jgi:hypothetical protein